MGQPAGARARPTRVGSPPASCGGAGRRSRTEERCARSTGPSGRRDGDDLARADDAGLDVGRAVAVHAVVPPATGGRDPLEAVEHVEGDVGIDVLLHHQRGGGPWA